MSQLTAETSVIVGRSIQESSKIPGVTYIFISFEEMQLVEAG